MPNLRSELLGLPDGLPRFRLLLPPGWSATPISTASAESFERSTRRVFMQAGRPDLDASFGGSLQQSMRDLERAGGRYVILPGAGSDGVAAPLSLIVSVVSGENGASLDGWVTERFRAGARMLDAKGQIVFWRGRRPDPAQGVDQVQSTYVIPVPETGRATALVFTGTTLVEHDAGEDDEAIIAGNAAFDAIVSTVSWVLVDADAVVG